MQLKEKDSISAIMVSIWAKTTSPNHAHLFFSLLFSDSSTLPLQNLTFHAPDWTYACAVMPTYKSIASVFVMPALTSDDVSMRNGASAEFDDLQISTFTEVFSPRNYFNSFPPECKVVTDMPILSPKVHAKFLTARCILEDTSITLCTHVTAAKFESLVVLANKWKGMAEGSGK